jgi:hypothetical protein
VSQPGADTCFSRRVRALSFSQQFLPILKISHKIVNKPQFWYYPYLVSILRAAKFKFISRRRDVHIFGLAVFSAMLRLDGFPRTLAIRILDKWWDCSWRTTRSRIARDLPDLTARLTGWQQCPHCSRALNPASRLAHSCHTLRVYAQRRQVLQRYVN